MRRESGRRGGVVERIEYERRREDRRESREVGRRGERKARGGKRAKEERT